MDLATIVTRLAAGLVLAASVSAPLAAGGGALNDPQETYSSEFIGPDRPVAPDTAGVSARVTVQFVAYELNAVGGKYRLIPVLLRIGARPAPLALSIEQDSLVVLSAGRRIPASFRLSALDRPLWDALSPEMKKRLTYPEQLNPNSASVVYAFVAISDLPGPPERFEYTIKALPAPLLLLPEPKKAAAALSRNAVAG